MSKTQTQMPSIPTSNRNRQFDLNEKKINSSGANFSKLDRSNTKRHKLKRLQEEACLRQGYRIGELDYITLQEFAQLEQTKFILPTDVLKLRYQQYETKRIEKVDRVEKDLQRHRNMNRSNHQSSPKQSGLENYSASYEQQSQTIRHYPQKSL